MEVWVVFGFTTTEPGPSGACFDRVFVGENPIVAPHVLMVTDDEFYAKEFQKTVVNIAKEEYGLNIVVGVQKIEADLFRHLMLAV